MGSSARKRIRECWRCDCDGVSHRSGVRSKGSEQYVVDLMADGIEQLTGYRPPTCPWRAMYDPLVAPVIRAARFGDRGLGHLATDEDPPAVLIDALGVYLSAREATRNHDDAEEHKAAIAKAKKGKR